MSSPRRLSSVGPARAGPTRRQRRTRPAEPSRLAAKPTWTDLVLQLDKSATSRPPTRTDLRLISSPAADSLIKSFNRPGPSGRSEVCCERSVENPPPAADPASRAAEPGSGSVPGPAQDGRAAGDHGKGRGAGGGRGLGEATRRVGCPTRIEPAVSRRGKPLLTTCLLFDHLLAV